MKTELTEPDEYFQVGQKDKSLTIYLRYSLFKALDEFATRENNREQVGLLVGRKGAGQDGRPFLLVEDAIETPVGDDKTGRFEATHWKRARRIAEARHANRKVVGWFHSHPEGKMETTDEEWSVHKRFFSEDDQVLYVIDPLANDRNFYRPGEGGFVASDGFCIYGKPARNEDVETPAPVEGARARLTTIPATVESQNRHLERTLDKVLKNLQNPPIGVKDFVIIALLLVNAGLIWFRPSPPVQVDTSALERGQAELSAQVTSVRNRIDKLENHLNELALLDEQLKIAAGMTDIDDPADPVATPNEVPKPPGSRFSTASEELKGGTGKVRLYKVVSGDTLSVLTTRFYPDSPTGTMDALARFNRLPAPDFAIFPGDTLKLPAPEVLR